MSPVLRPHFITQRQYNNLVKAAEALYCAIDRIEKMALSTPSLMSRMQMLPAEKMLASVDPGYPYLSVTSLLDTHLNNGSLQFVGYAADTPAGVVYGEAFNNAFYDAPPVKEFRKKYPLGEVRRIKASAAIAAEGVSRVWRQEVAEYRNSRIPASLPVRRQRRVCSVDGKLPSGRAIGPK